MGHPEMMTEESLARQWEARCEIAERGLKRWHEAAKVWLAAGKRALEEQRSILDALGWSEDCADGPIALIEKICRDHNKYQQIAYAAEDEPTVPAIDPGEGWRLLRAGEKIEKGDEVYFDEDDWFGSVDVGLIHLGEDDPPDMVRRRRIAAPPPAEPVAYPPSSAPEAVEVAPPQPAPVVCSADAASSEPRAQHPEQHEAPPALPAPRPVLPRPMPPELRAAIIRAQMAGGGS